MAAPHVAGLAALIKEKNPSFNPDQIRQIIESTAVDYGGTGKDIYYGSGLVDALDSSDGIYEKSVTLRIDGAAYIFTDGEDAKKIKAVVYDENLVPVSGAEVTLTVQNGSVSDYSIHTGTYGEAETTLISNSRKYISRINASCGSYGKQSLEIMLKRTDVALNNVWMSTDSDSEGRSNLKNTFYPGQKVFIMFDLFNHYYKPQNATIEYSVKNELGEIIGNLSGSFDEVITGEMEFYSWYDLPYSLGQYWTSTYWMEIPESMEKGTYTICATVTADGKTSSFQSRFTVLEPSPVLIYGGSQYIYYDRPFGTTFYSTITHGGYYVSALNELLYNYTYWDRDLEGDLASEEEPIYEEEPPVEPVQNMATFNDWAVSIIFEPAFAQDVFRGALSGYLRNGGKILVTSEWALLGGGEAEEPYLMGSGGSKVKPVDPESNPFGVAFKEQLTDPEKVYSIAGELFDNLVLDINWRNWDGDGAINQLLVDAFTIPYRNFTVEFSNPYDPMGETVRVDAVATPLLYYKPGLLAGSSVETENLYQGVFLSFGFEGINEPDKRNEIIRRCFEWFFADPVIYDVTMYNAETGEEVDEINEGDYGKVVISGRNFVPTGVTKVLFNGEEYEVSVDVVDKNTIEIEIPPLSIPAGTYSLTVVSPDGRTVSEYDAVVITPDIFPPSIFIEGVEDGETYYSPVVINFYIEDSNLTSYTATLNDQPFESGTEVFEEGEYTLVIVAEDSAGNGAMATVRFRISVEPAFERIAGANRIETAVEVSRNFFEMADVALLATAFNYPDALAAAPLAKALNAPVLLTRSDYLPPGVFEELQRLMVTTVYIIGGEGAVSSDVEDELISMGYTVKRIGGENRYETAAMIAEELRNVLGAAEFDKAYIVTGENFPDALSAGPVAAIDECPILLIRKNSVPIETESALLSLGVDEAIVIGGPGVISDTALNSLGLPYQRIWGENRYRTSVRVLEYAIDKLSPDMSRLLVACGTNYPDALSAGPAAARNRNLVLLAPSMLPLDDVTVEFFLEHMEINEVFAIGGDAVLTEPVVIQILELLR
jgi:putative cell wall-binding protein